MLLLADILDRLLGLSRLSWSDARTSVGWRFPLPAWAWILIVLAALVLAGWSYRKLLGNRLARIGLSGVRALILMLIAALLAGPMLVLNQEQVDPDWLLVLVDRSASMNVADAPAPGSAPGTLTPGMPRVVNAGEKTVARQAALVAALRAQADVFGAEKLGKNRRIVWLGFDSSTYEIGAAKRPGASDAAGGGTTRPSSSSSDTAPPEVLPAEVASTPLAIAALESAKPDGQSTLLRTAIEQALQRGAGRPIAGVVVMSDGRTPQATGGDLVRRLRQQAVPVFAVPLGSENTKPRVVIASVDAPDRAFINDAVPVGVALDAGGAEAKVDPSNVVVRLIDTATGAVLDEKRATDVNLRTPVRLTSQSATVGPTRWRVEVKQNAPGSASDDTADASPNEDPFAIARKRDVTIDFTDRPLRVLYVEGYPRWEYRYVKNMLVREKTVQSSMMLLSADRAFAQEGSMPITRLPRTSEELKPFDVIVMGDVPPNYFTSDEMTLLRDHVALRGASLLWIGGAIDMPRNYEQTPLSGLLPMRRPSAVDRADPALGAAQVRPTPLAEALSVLRLWSTPASPSANKPAGDAKATAWPEKLPPLEWYQTLGELKPGAEVLAEAVGQSGKPQPLVVRLRYGRGQSVYVGTDETWRWRYGRGELYFEQFWIQIVRMLARSRLQQGNDRANLAINPRRLEVDQTGVVTLRIQDELIMQRRLDRVAVAVTRESEGGKPVTVERIELLRKAVAGAGASGAPLPGAPAGAGTSVTPDMEYETNWRPTLAGRLTLKVVEPALDDLNITQEVEVVRSDDELRQPAPDFDRLAALAKDTGGAVVQLGDLNELTRLVPNRAKRTPNDIREPLGESYLSFILLLVLLTGEWVGRKMIRLV